MNEGSYTCNATNSAGADEWSYQVHVVPLSSSYNHHHSNGKIIPAASSDSQVYPKRGDRVAGGRQGVAITGGDLNESEFACFLEFYQLNELFCQLQLSDN